jgi:hypothetical protein
MLLERGEDLSAPDGAGAPASARQPCLHTRACGEARGLAAEQLRDADPSFGGAPGKARVHVVV